jgi:hypothetical protein
LAQVNPTKWSNMILAQVNPTKWSNMILAQVNPSKLSNMILAHGMLMHCPCSTVSVSFSKYKTFLGTRKHREKLRVIQPLTSEAHVKWPSSCQNSVPRLQCKTVYTISCKSESLLLL